MRAAITDTITKRNTVSMLGTYRHNCHGYEVIGLYILFEKKKEERLL